MYLFPDAVYAIVPLTICAYSKLTNCDARCSAVARWCTHSTAIFACRATSPKRFATSTQVYFRFPHVHTLRHLAQVLTSLKMQICHSLKCCFFVCVLLECIFDSMCTSEIFFVVLVVQFFFVFVVLSLWVWKEFYFILLILRE